ncbi:MAG: flavodoxin family protein [Clostridia bacterium]|nr:flavodoxin family protein [Clostridia bacterium]
MKKVVVVTSSPRKDGNSEILAKNFAQGARDVGHEVKFVAVRDVDLKFCTGCMYCQSHGKCVLKDGMNSLYDDFQNADALVFATPVYYYSVSGQLKTFLDRLNPLYSRENKFKEVYLLATAAENEESAMDGSVIAIQGWIDCFDGVTLKGVLRGIGVDAKGEILNTDFPQTAYEMGSKV